MGVFRDFLHRLFGTTHSYQGRSQGEHVKSPSFHDWSEADHVAVEMTTPNESGYGRIELQSTALGDAQINFESRNDREMQKGTILLVSGGWMATKDLALAQGFEMDTVDGALIQVHLLIALLFRAFPAGPTSVRREERVNLEEMQTAIEVGVGAAFASYGVPWSLSGTVRKTQTEVVEYDLSFSFLTGASPTGQVSRLVRRLTGMVEKVKESFALPDSFMLQGWSVFRFGPALANSSLDYMARPAEISFGSVGELRKASRQNCQNW
jgi:hypothetical protein